MARPIERIRSDLDALQEADFDELNPEATGLERLEELCEELSDIGDPKVCAPPMLHTIERMGDVELGSPGPLVHTLETWYGAGYEPFLKESVARMPTPLSVWMVTRIMNSNPPDLDEWVAILQMAAEHPQASETTKSCIEDYFSDSEDDDDE